MTITSAWLLSIALLSMISSSIDGKRFFVSDYGAYPNDGLDDSHTIQSTINEAINDGSVNDIIFGIGIYAISSTLSVFNATNLTITGAGVDQTYLIGYNPVTIFSAQYCQGLNLTAFSIDYDPLPFTAGYVVNVNDRYIDIEIVSPHQADVNRQVGTILRYDPVQMRPAFGPNTYEIYQIPPIEANTSLVSPGVLRIPLTSPAQFLKGDPVVARYTFQGHAIYGQDVPDMTVQSLTIYTSWSMGFVTLRSKRLNIIQYHVLPYNRRWMSTSADCMHFVDTREYVSISDSQCQAMGDDGLNVHAIFFTVTELIDAMTIIIDAINWSEPLNFEIGTTLEFSDHQQPFTVHGRGTVSSSVFNSTLSRKVTFTNPVNTSVGDWACVADTPANTKHRYSTIDIRQSIFNQTSGPAVLIQPSMYWHEGPEARNISLIENIYINNNEGIAQEKGIITVLPDPVQLIPVIHDIRIESSTFHLGMFSQGLLQSNNLNNFLLQGNYIVTNSSTPIISICNSRNLSASNNCVVNNQTLIHQYYIFDQSTPCSANLSSLIDLPPSAFNSSFPPPVIFSQASG